MINNEYASQVKLKINFDAIRHHLCRMSRITHVIYSQLFIATSIELIMTSRHTSSAEEIPFCIHFHTLLNGM